MNGKDDFVKFISFEKLKCSVCERMEEERGVEWGMPIVNGIEEFKPSFNKITPFSESFNCSDVAFSNKDLIKLDRNIFTHTASDQFETCIFGEKLINVISIIILFFYYSSFLGSACIVYLYCYCYYFIFLTNNYIHILSGFKVLHISDFISMIILLAYLLFSFNFFLIFKDLVLWIVNLMFLKVDILLQVQNKVYSNFYTNNISNTYHFLGIELSQTCFFLLIFCLL